MAASVKRSSATRLRIAVEAACLMTKVICQTQLLKVFVELLVRKHLFDFHINC